MAGLVRNATIVRARRALERTLVHTYTRTPSMDGPDDDHYDATSVPGAPTIGVRCTYEESGRVVRDERGVLTVLGPTLTVSATDPLKKGDEVSDVADQLGGVLARGPLYASRVVDNTAGLGAPLLVIWELSGATPERSSI